MTMRHTARPMGQLAFAAICPYFMAAMDVEDDAMTLTVSLPDSRRGPGQRHQHADDG
jgi:hypothetical protein